MKTSQRRRKKENSFDFNEYWNEMPNSVMFVKAMAMTNQPVNLEMYERALEEGGEKYFPDEIRWRRIWESIPQTVKDAYDADPRNTHWKFDDENELAIMPEAMKNWPGILRATDEDWRIRNEYYNSEAYKSYWDKKCQANLQAWNDHFKSYGLIKTLEDFK